MGCCLSSQMNPENLFSIKTFEENENESVDKKPESVDEDCKIKDCNESDAGETRRDGDDIDAALDQPEECKSSATVSRKRKKSSSISDDSAIECKKKFANSDCKLDNSNSAESDRSLNVEEIETPRPNKRKLSENESEATQNDTETAEKLFKMNPENENNEADMHEENTRCSELPCDENDCKEVEQDMNNDEERRNKNRKRRKKNKKNKIGANSHGLQILSKAQWKSLRNKYLNEQRKKMKEFKQYVQKYKKQEYHDTDNTKTEENNDEDSSQNGDVKESITVSSRLTLSPGLIVKITLNESVISKSSFESEAKIFSGIKFIDAVSGSNVVYVRFATTTAAEDCVKSGHWVNAEIIKGKEEQSYWDKIIVEREEKLNKGRSTRKGRDKLLKKAEEMHMKHIWFD